MITAALEEGKEATFNYLENDWSLLNDPVPTPDLDKPLKQVAFMLTQCLFTVMKWLRDDKKLKPDKF